MNEIPAYFALLDTGRRYWLHSALWLLRAAFQLVKVTFEVLFIVFALGPLCLLTWPLRAYAQRRARAKGES